MPNAHSRNVPESCFQAMPFHGDQIITFEADSVAYVAMRRICENLGLAWARQADKLMEQKEKFSCIHMCTTGADGKTYKMLSMPTSKLALWLASINPLKLKDPKKREKLEYYQEESAIALHNYWTKGAAVRGSAEVTPELLKALEGAVHKQIVEIIPALVAAQIAQQQMTMIRGVSAGEVIKMAGVQDRKGLRGLARFVSNRLRRYHARKGVAVKLAELGLHCSYMFDPSLSRDWLLDGGRDAIEKKISERRGQGVLRLVVAPT